MQDTKEAVGAKNVIAGDQAKSIPPLMSLPERDLYASLLQPNSSVVEYGCGGSTIFALRKGIAQICSVESDEAWARNVRRHNSVAPSVRSGKAIIKLVDIGETGHMGYPKKGSDPKLWHRYWMTPWEFRDPSQTSVVLVDGRFRLACAFSSLLLVGDDTKIVFHDFQSRAHYHSVLDFATVVAKVDEMVVLVRKPSIDRSKLLSALMSASFDPR